MTTTGKILAHDALRARLDEARALGRRIVLANGCFDLLHVGHSRYLASARAQGDLLVVAVNSDSSVRRLKGAGRPILDQQGRAELVAALAAVDYVILFDEPNVEALLAALRPAIHAKGTDYTADTVPEREAAARLGVRVAIVGDLKRHSTRDLFASIRQSSDG